MTQTLENRIRVLEDIEAIKKLKALYTYTLDLLIAGDTGKIDELMNLFADDVIGEYGELGIYEGKEALTSFYKDTVTAWISFAAHLVHNPIIDMEGDRAKGRWYFENPVTMRKENKAAYVMGTYFETYVKIEGKWKFKTFKAVFEYITPYDEGWVKTRMRV